MIREGKLYTSELSDLAVYVIKIYFESKDYIKAKIRVENKRNHIIYEIKTYKLYKNKIDHWNIS